MLCQDFKNLTIVLRIQHFPLSHEHHCILPKRSERVATPSFENDVSILDHTLTKEIKLTILKTLCQLISISNYCDVFLVPSLFFFFSIICPIRCSVLLLLVMTFKILLHLLCIMLKLFHFFLR